LLGDGKGGSLGTGGEKERMGMEEEWVDAKVGERTKAARRDAGVLGLKQEISMVGALQLLDTRKSLKEL